MGRTRRTRLLQLAMLVAGLAAFVLAPLVALDTAPVRAQASAHAGVRPAPWDASAFARGGIEAPSDEDEQQRSRLAAGAVPLLSIARAIEGAPSMIRRVAVEPRPVLLRSSSPRPPTRAPPLV